MDNTLLVGGTFTITSNTAGDLQKEYNLLDSIAGLNEDPFSHRP